MTDVDVSAAELFAQLQRVADLVAQSRWQDAADELARHDALLRALLDATSGSLDRERHAPLLRQVLAGEHRLLDVLERARDAGARELGVLRQGRHGIGQYEGIGNG